MVHFNSLSNLTPSRSTSTSETLKTFSESNQATIDAYSEKEESAYNTRLEQVIQKNRRLETDKQIKLLTKPVIVEDKMSTDDWVTVTRYMQILKPLMLVTKKLEGYPQ